MPYCPRCGVEIEVGIEKCPLCGTPIQPLEEPDWSYKYFPETPKLPRMPPMTAKQRRMFAWEIVSVSLLVISLLVLMLNVIINHTVSWSLYPLAGLVAAWLLATFPLFFPKKPFIIVAGEVGTIMILLLVIDAIDSKIQWYHKLALPIIVIILIITSVIVFLSIKVGKSVNIAAFILFGIATICVGVDIYTHKIIEGYFSATWSLIVLPPLTIIGLFLLYVQYRLTQRVNLRKRMFI